MIAASNAAEARRVKREQSQGAEAKGEIEKIGHERSPKRVQLQNLGSDAVKSRLGRCSRDIKKT